MRKYHPKRPLKRIPNKARRTTALTLCAAMVLSLATYVMPSLAAGNTGSRSVYPVSYKDLYIREADENTMDSYVQASLGGQVYLQWDVDGVSTPTVRNNYGTRYAGEVWADKSVFALDQRVIPEIRPFEAGHKYSTSELVESAYKSDKVTELQRALDTLNKWGVEASVCGLSNDELRTALEEGTLTAAQASALNTAVNGAIEKAFTGIGSTGNHDGYFDGENLHLGKYTDGVDFVVPIGGLSDFLEVFSVLGSSEVVDSMDGAVLDVVFIMDASGSLNDSSKWLFMTGVEGETYTTDSYSYIDDKGKTVTVENDHTNVNSRLEFAADALNSVFGTLMGANDYNRVALLTYNNASGNYSNGVYSVDGINIVLSLGRYEPTLVQRNGTESEGYYNGATRYFTIAQDGRARSNGKAGDTRFADVLSYNYTGDSATVDNEWNIIEVGAVPEGTKAGKETLLAGSYGGHTVPTTDTRAIPVKDENGNQIYQYQYIGTSSMTETQMGIVSAMENILGKADTTLTLYRDSDGNLTNDPGVNNVKVDEIQRRPVVILLTDGRINPTDSYEKWWTSAGNSIDTSPGNGSLTNYGNMPLYIAATASLWKKVINTNYFRNPNGADGMDTLFYTFGLCLNDTIEMDSGLWTGLNEDDAKKTLDAFFRGGGTDNDKGQLGELTAQLDALGGALDGLPNELKDKYSTQIGNIKKLITEIKNYYTTGELSKSNIDTLTLADREKINTLASIVLIRNGDDPTKTPYGNGNDNLNRLTRFLVNDLTKENIDAAAINRINAIINEIGNITQGLEAKVAYDAAQAYVDYIKGVSNAFNWGTILQKKPTGTLALSNGTLDLDYGTFKAANNDVLYNGGAAAYRPQSVSDLDFADEFYNVTNPQDLPTMLGGLVAELAKGSVFTVVSGSNSAGFSDSLTFSDPIGDYMTIDGVTYVTLFGHVYQVAESDTYNSNNIPKYIQDYLDSIGNSKEKTANTTFTVYEIVKDETTGEPVDAGTVRTNESTGEKFNLRDSIHIWVEDTGKWRDSDGSDFIVDNAYSQALYINVSAKALPTQIATILLKNGMPVNYTTNLDDYKASTPLRVFYNVSLAPEYLRYEEDFNANSKDARQHAVGVALSKISPEYLGKNTAYYAIDPDGDGHYDKVKTASGAGRYTAFYSNYFTDSEYNNYPVMSDTTKNSRGNATITFSPGEYNQFYRFQKDRVLYLIPGAFGLDERPAEIDFGDLVGTDYYVNTEYGIISKSPAAVTLQVEGDNGTNTVSASLVKLDPTNYLHLLALLNAYRANLNWKGMGAINSEGVINQDGSVTRSAERSTYWRFGNCALVDGSMMTHAMIHKYYDSRKKAYGYTDENDKDDNLHTQLEANLKKAGHYDEDEKAYSMPTIDSENWYYIIREFYYPVFEGSSNTTTNVEVRYMAIARKGTEFGSGIGGDMGEEIEWYAPNVTITPEQEAYGYSNTADFTSAAGEMYGRPGDYSVKIEDGSVKTGSNKDPVSTPNPPSGYTGEVPAAPTVPAGGAKWYISAKPGGLRVGGLANFAGVKGYDIREGVGEGDFNKSDDDSVKRIGDANVTDTAKTYYLPTVSRFASRSVSNIAVNVYLGNNGRILVHDSTLAVTKTVNTTATDAKSEKFAFEIEIEDFYGDRGAVVITRDEFNSSLWRRRFDTIDVLTDNRSLLLGDDNNLAMVDGKGQRVVAVERVSKDGDTTGNLYYLARKGANGEVIKYAKANAEGLKVFEAGDKVYLVKVDTYGNFTYIFRNEADREGADTVVLAAAGQPLEKNYEYIDNGANKWDSDPVNGILIPDIWPEDESKDDNARADVYYVYVGKNLRNIYDDKTLRVFKAVYTDNDNDGFVDQDKDRALTGLGDIYGNESLRGGRTYYVTAAQYNNLDEKVKKNANVTWDGEEKPDGLIVNVENDKAKQFIFHIIPEGGQNGYQAGDREFWINKVYLIPISKVNDDWQNTFANYEKYSDKGVDWRQGYDAADDVPGYTMLPKFNVAHIRASDLEGATTATELASNNGFYTTSSFLTTKVSFTPGDHEGFGTAKITLTDGQGLGFNNIDNEAAYVVTECITEKQTGKGIHFEQAEHVQDGLRRTKYQYSTGDNTVTTDAGNAKYDQYGVIIDEATKYWGKNSLGKNVAIQESYQGGTYYWQDGVRKNNSVIGVTADFSKGVPPVDENGNVAKNWEHPLRYTIVGQTSSNEQAVHYVNFLPDIVKIEFTPGENESVYTDDLITYGIRWENFEYSTVLGKSMQAEVIIRDVLDPGLTFVSAVFNPYHSNMMDDKDTTFSGENFLEEYTKVPELRKKYANEGTLSQAEADLIAKWDIWDSADLTVNANDTDPASAKYYADGDAAAAAGTTPVPKVETLNHADGALPQMTVKVEYEPDTTGGETGGTVIWTITDAPADAYGYVELTVRVNTDAVKDWNYDVDAGTGTWGPENEDNRVHNRASVKVGEITRHTEIITNPTGEVEKEETAPGNGFQVMPGDQVDYYIGWTNSTATSNTVIIEDRLDPGVYFCQAWVDGKDADGKDVKVKIPSDENPKGYSYDENTALLETEGDNKIAMGDAQVGVTITYDPQSHLITWELKGVPAYYSGKVYFSVIVNEKANQKWTNMDIDDAENRTDDDGYNWPAEKDENGKYPAPEWGTEADPDYRIYNRARVGIDNEWKYTDIVENPTRPEKKELTPGDSDGDGKNDTVTVGQQITYTVTWQNSSDVAATVTVTDNLDPGVTFVEAGIIGIEEGSAKQRPIPILKTGEGSKTVDGCTVTEAKNGDIVTITWQFENRTAGASGMVYLVVEVNERAFENWGYTNEQKPGDIVQGSDKDDKVVNKAGIQVGNKDTQYTEVVENPVEKPETASLTIKKTVRGEGAPAGTTFTFTVTLTPPEGKTLPAELNTSGDGTLAGSNGTYTVTLKDGQSLTISGLPVGTTYTVVENKANLPDGYEYASGEVTDGKQLGKDGAIVEVINTYTKPQEDPETASLTIKKTVRGEGAPAGTTFTFTVTLTPPEGKTLPEELNTSGDGTLTGSNGTYTVTLKDGQSLTINGLPVGTTYTVVENKANLPDGYEYASGEVSSQQLGKDGANVEVVNTYTKPQEDPETASLRITKTVRGEGAPAGTTFTFTVTLTPPEGKTLPAGIQSPYTFTLRAGQTETINGLPVGTTYTVVENKANLPDGYEYASGEVTDGKQLGKDGANVEVVNTYTKPQEDPETVSLRITKTVKNADDSALTQEQLAREFTFTLRLTAPEGETLPEKLTTSGDGALTGSNGTYTVTLRHGQTLTISGLPVGTEYEITEDSADGYVSSGENTSGTILEGLVTAAFVNVSSTDTPPDPAKGNLTVSKTVDGNAGNQFRGFHFTVTLSDSEINGTYGDMTFVDGVASFTLRHGQSKTAVDLPAGITYSVTEAEADQDGYDTTASGSTGTIPDGDAAAASFVNTKNEEIEPATGNLIVSKIVGGSDGDRNQAFTFAVVLSDNTINGTYGDMTFVNGVARFTLKHGESKTATGLPSGITYTVMEREANQDGYSTASKGRDGTILDQGTAQASFFNTKGEPLPDDPALEEFDDPDIPLGGFPDFPDVPQTGDSSHPALWLSLMILSAIGLLLVGLSFKKKSLFSEKDRNMR